MSVPDEMQIGDPQWNQLIIKGAGNLGIQVSEIQVAQLGDYSRELLFWNQTSNLTAITRPDEVAIKHILDSLAISRWIHPDGTMLDVGSGGGFPGIPLKILMPSLSVTLIDSSRKKNSFQRHVIRRLGLVGIVALQTRAETFSAEPDHARTFSIIVCRAFSDLAHFIEMTLPLLTPGGRIIAMKGRIGSKEAAGVSMLISALRRAGSNLQAQTICYDLPFIGAERSLYVVSMKNSLPLISGKG